MSLPVLQDKSADTKLEINIYIHNCTEKNLGVIHLSDKRDSLQEVELGVEGGKAKREESLLHLTVCTLTRLEIVTMNMYYL